MLSINETKSLSRHFLAICSSRSIDEQGVVDILPIKTFQAFLNWTVGANRMQGPSERVIRGYLEEWGFPDDPNAMVDAYMTMALELSAPQRWELAFRLLKDLRG